MIITKTDIRERRIHEAFEIGIILKGLNALIELTLGLLFLFVDVRGIVETLIQNELVEDPNDFLANHLLPIANHLPPNAELYSALYLLSHGLIKIVLVWSLLKNKVWAYPASLAVLGLFVAYQSIKFLGNHSIALALLTIFDLVLIWLIYHEYRHLSASSRD
jgi:uncharacterized membrane protein